MHTPKRLISWLESFPPDVWAYFVGYLSAELPKLLKTGATLLRLRLKSPNVVSFINLGEFRFSFKLCPVFLNDFPSLETLVIHIGINDWKHGTSPLLESIPSGVRKIELIDFSCEDRGVNDKSLSLFKRFPQLEVLKLSHVMIGDYSWMAHSPQSLTKLRLDEWNGIVALPSSLIHFEASDVALQSSSFVSELPPSLDSFIVEDHLYGFDLLIPLLPPSTRKLHLPEQVTHSGGPTSHQTILRQLPNCLTCCTVPSSTETNFEANPEFASLLPSTLTELIVVPVFPCSAWHLLPPQLTKLSFTVSVSIDTTSGVRFFPFDSLPRSITRLELFSWIGDKYFCGTPDVSKPSYFPPQLTYLKIPYIQLSLETIKLLPFSLTHLEMRNLCQRVCEHLPTGLKTLISPKVLMGPKLITFLPKSLTYLGLTMARPNDQWFDSSTGESVDSVSTLAEFSIHENCALHKFDWGEDSALPPKLTCLHLLGATGLGDSFMIHQRLPNLLQFSSYSNYYSDLSIPLLSPHLTYLDLEWSSIISGRSFVFLPRNLTSLNLDLSESIFDPDIQHLPRTLKRVYFRHASQLTDLCVPDLPPHLETLHTDYNSKITPSSFPRFPFPLQSSRFNSCVIFSRWRAFGGKAHTKNNLFQ